MQIIDIHTHIYPDSISHKAAESIRDFYHIAGDREMDGSGQLLLQRGKAAGISRFVVLPVSIRPNSVRQINDFAAQQQAQQPLFTAFGTIHAKMDGLLDETRRIMELGLHGVKMHPDSQRFAIDDPRLYPFYEEVSGKLPVLLHMGDSRYNYSHPLKLSKVLTSFPRLQVIAAHFGGYSMYQTAYELLKDTECIFDISSSLMFMPDGVAEQYINAYGAERMAFGSDYPLWDPVTQVERFLQLRLRPEQLEQLAWKTAKRFLKL